MLFRIVLVAAVILSPVTPSSGLQAQADEDDHAAVLVGAIRAYADFRHVPLDQLVVDIGKVGVERSPGPAGDRARLVAVQRVRAEAAKSGFHVASTSVGPWDAWHAGKFPPGFAFLGDTAAKVLSITLEIQGDSAVVFLNAATALFRERMEVADLMTYTFARREGTWELVESRRGTGEVARW